MGLSGAIVGPGVVTLEKVGSLVTDRKPIVASLLALCFA